MHSWLQGPRDPRLLLDASCSYWITIPAVIALAVCLRVNCGQMVSRLSSGAVTVAHQC
jgi:hypothetical protein